MGDQPVATPLPNTNKINTDIQALSGIRTHDRSVRADEDISRLRGCATVIGMDPSLETGVAKEKILYKKKIEPQTSLKSVKSL
jgi:hypothetical protein